MIEYYEFTKDRKILEVIEGIKRYLSTNLSDYNFNHFEPTYSINDFSQFKNKFHFINFESDKDSSNSSELPIYELSLVAEGEDSKQREILRVMRTTGGSKNYEFEQFIKGTEFNFLLSSDASKIDQKGIYIVNFYLRDSSGKIVGKTEAKEEKFYGKHWSAPMILNNYYVREFYPGADPYQGVDETGHFKIILDEDVVSNNNLFLEVEYIKLTKNPINIYMYNQGRYNLGFLEDSSSSQIRKELFYIPRANDFSSYSFYLGWRNVETIDGRRAQRINQAKDYRQWNGGWVKFKIDESDLPLLNDKTKFYLNVKYFDANDETIFVNFYNGGNRPLGILNNTGSMKWMEETFEIPSELLIKEGSSSPKTKIVIDTLTYLSNKWNDEKLGMYAKHWEQSALYDSNKRSFILYQKAENSNKYLVSFNHDRVYIPGETLQKWENQGKNYILELKDNDFAYFSIPKELVEETEITIKFLDEHGDTLLNLAKLGFINAWGNEEKDKVISLGLEPWKNDAELQDN